MIFNNEAWEAVKVAALQVHPAGWAAGTKNFPLSNLAPAPRYEEIVRAPPERCWHQPLVAGGPLRWGVVGGARGFASAVPLMSRRAKDTARA